jgi:hypothetical protein
MNKEGKSLGLKPQIVVGVGPHTITSGYKAYACKVRVDNTQIKSYTRIKNDAGDTEVVTNDTFESINLLAGIDYIPFEDPIVAITLNSVADSITLFLEPYNT